MNIHWDKESGQKMSTPEYRARHGRKVMKNTKEPITRPGKTYPGGKHMRRALARLAMRNIMRDETLADGARNRPGIEAAFKNVPGSMSK